MMKLPACIVFCTLCCKANIPRQEAMTPPSRIPPMILLAEPIQYPLPDDVRAPESCTCPRICRPCCLRFIGCYIICLLPNTL
jgi:hypothetical protein